MVMYDRPGQSVFLYPEEAQAVPYPHAALVFTLKTFSCVQQRSQDAADLLPVIPSH